MSAAPQRRVAVRRPDPVREAVNAIIRRHPRSFPGEKTGFMLDRGVDDCGVFQADATALVAGLERLARDAREDRQ